MLNKIFISTLLIIASIAMGLASYVPASVSNLVGAVEVSAANLDPKICDGQTTGWRGDFVTNADILSVLSPSVFVEMLKVSGLYTTDFNNNVPNQQIIDKAIAQRACVICPANYYCPGFRSSDGRYYSPDRPTPCPANTSTVGYTFTKKNGTVVVESNGYGAFSPDQCKPKPVEPPCTPGTPNCACPIQGQVVRNGVCVCPDFNNIVDGKCVPIACQPPATGVLPNCVEPVTPTPPTPPGKVCDIRQSNPDCTCPEGKEVWTNSNGIKFCKDICKNGYERGPAGNCRCPASNGKIVYKGKCVDKCKANEVRNDKGVCEEKKEEEEKKKSGGSNTGLIIGGIAAAVGLCIFVVCKGRSTPPVTTQSDTCKSGIYSTYTEAKRNAGTTGRVTKRSDGKYVTTCRTATLTPPTECKSGIYSTYTEAKRNAGATGRVTKRSDGKYVTTCRTATLRTPPARTTNYCPDPKNRGSRAALNAIQNADNSQGRITYLQYKAAIELASSAIERDLNAEPGTLVVNRTSCTFTYRNKIVVDRF